MSSVLEIFPPVHLCLRCRGTMGRSQRCEADGCTGLTWKRGQILEVCELAERGRLGGLAVGKIRRQLDRRRRVSVILMQLVRDLVVNEFLYTAQRIERL